MLIQISPATSSRKSTPSCPARVTYVSGLPIDVARDAPSAQNDQLINGLRETPRRTKCTADLIGDPSTVSQFRWSSSKGPPVHIQSGTLASANIQIASRRSHLDGATDSPRVTGL